MKRILIALLAVAAVASSVALVCAQTLPPHAKPAWVYLHDPRPNAFLGTAGPSFTGYIKDFPFVMGSSFDVVSGNTSVNVFNAMFSDTPTDVAQNLGGSQFAVNHIKNADWGESFYWTVTNIDDSTAITYRWNGLHGMEWSIDRGIVMTQADIIDPFNNYIIMSTGVQTGSDDVIIAVFTQNSKRKIVWTSAIPTPAINQKALQSYARDFLWLYESKPTLAFITLGRVFAMDSSTGTIIKTQQTPCGYSSADFRMQGVATAHGYRMLVYGNVKGAGAGNTDAFVICALNMTDSVDFEFVIVLDSTVTLANADFSIKVTRTAYKRQGMFFTMETLFFAGMKDNNAPGDKQRLWMYDITQRHSPVLLQSIYREIIDQYNMPVAIYDTDDEHVAVTINGSMVGLDPSNGKYKWSCANIQEGCQGTPAVQRSGNLAAGRLACVSSSNMQRIIAIDVSSTNPCALVWATDLDSTVDVVLQNKPGISTINTWPVEPYITVPSNTGKLYTISFRSGPEPTPPPKPAPPTPKPAPPPAYNLPEYTVTLAPPGDFMGLSLRSSPAITAFKKEGPMIAASGTCSIPNFRGQQLQDGTGRRMLQDPAVPEDEHSRTIHEMHNAKGWLLAQQKKGRSNDDDATTSSSSNVGFGTARTVLYFESAEVASIRSPIYGFVLMSYQASMSDPLPLYSDTSSYSVASWGVWDTTSMYILYTAPGSVTGTYYLLERDGCSTKAASDVDNGLLFYTVGVTEQKTQHLYAVKQKGDGAKTTVIWGLSITPPAKYSINYCYTGDVIFTRTVVHKKGVIAFSSADSLALYDSSTGTQLNVEQNPCGFVPTASRISGFYQAALFTITTSSVAYIAAVIDTYSTEPNSFGICILDTSDYQFKNPFKLTYTTYVANIVGMGDAGIYTMDTYDGAWTSGYLSAVDLSTNQLRWRVARNNAVGSDMYNDPGTMIMYTNMDDKQNYMILAAVNAQDGTILAQCDFACYYFTMVADGNGNHIIICALYMMENIVRAVYFDPSRSYSCTVRWELDVGAPVYGFARTPFVIDFKRYVTLMTDTGYIFSISPDGFVAPTLAPVAGDTYPHPAENVTVTLDPFMFINPLVIMPGVAEVKSNDFSYGAVSFVAVSAQVNISVRDEQKPQEQQQPLGAFPQKVALVAYGLKAGAPKPVTRILSPFTLILSPQVFYAGQDRTAAYIQSLPPVDGRLHLLSFPGGAFNVDRRGALTPPVHDGKGNVFFSIGTVNNVEQFACYSLAADGLSLTQKWSVPFTPPGELSKLTYPNFTTHIGFPAYVAPTTYDHGHVVFSFFDSLYTLDEWTGAIISATQQPCGYVSPVDPYEYEAPWSMIVFSVRFQTTGTSLSMGNDSYVVVVINSEKSLASGAWGVCVMQNDGKTVVWNQTLYAVDKFRSLTPLQPTGVKENSYFLIDIRSDKNGGGNLYGFNLGSGSKWNTLRRFANGQETVGVPADSSFFAGNMDTADGKAMAFAYVTSATGKAVTYCDFACDQKPSIVSTQYLPYPLFVCARADNPKVLRAVYFDTASSNTTVCQVYWEKVYDQFVESTSYSHTGILAVQLSNGATDVLTVRSNIAPSPSDMWGSHGPSAGVIVAIIILVVLLVGVVVAIGLAIRKRNVRRAAISESTIASASPHTSDLQYGNTEGYGST